jgi:F0F1-type ATP synthase alpha subunit
MKQPQYQPLSLVQEVVIIFAASNGFVDDVPVARVKDFERDLYRFMETQYKPLADRIAKEKKFDADIEKQVRTMIEEFKKTVSYDAAKPTAPAPKTAAPASVRPASAPPTPAEPRSKVAGHS